jgi:hypothetical protein
MAAAKLRLALKQLVTKILQKKRTSRKHLSQNLHDNKMIVLLSFRFFLPERNALYHEAFAPFLIPLIRGFFCLLYLQARQSINVKSARCKYFLR